MQIKVFVSMKKTKACFYAESTDPIGQIDVVEKGSNG